jgi:hypothetical protein
VFNAAASYVEGSRFKTRPGDQLSFLIFFMSLGPSRQMFGQYFRDIDFCWQIHPIKVAIRSLGQRIHSLLLNRKLHYRVHERPSLIPVLRRVNPIYALFVYDPFYYYICTKVSVFQVISFLQILRSENFLFLISPMHATYPTHFIVHDLIILTICGDEYKF